jgi:hypothetical protein
MEGGWIEKTLYHWVPVAFLTKVVSSDAIFATDNLALVCDNVKSDG